MELQYIILVPGLGDHVNRVDFATKHWKKYGVIPIVFEAPWKKKEESLAPKLQRLYKKIDELSKTGEVSLVGMSAGGSFVLNAYMEKRDKVKRVINICGRLREGGFPSLVYAAIGFPAFKESVITCEKNLGLLTAKDKQKIMTISPFFDGIVPLSAIPVEGATNIKIPFVYHSIAISAALIFYKKCIVEFIFK